MLILIQDGFIVCDGLTNYNEMTGAVQNVSNMGYDLSDFLAVFSTFITDGDCVTRKMSIGCNATTRTSINPSISSSQPGLDGYNKFEAGTSLMRTDYFLADGDNFSVDGTLFDMMAETTGGILDLDGLALYRFQYYQQSRRDNPNL